MTCELEIVKRKCNWHTFKFPMIIANLTSTGDAEKVKRLDALVTKMAGFEKYYAVTGQTYSRKVDIECLNVLSSLGATIHKVSPKSCSCIRVSHKTAAILKGSFKHPFLPSGEVTLRSRIHLFLSNFPRFARTFVFSLT